MKRAFMGLMGIIGMLGWAHFVLAEELDKVDKVDEVDAGVPQETAPLVPPVLKEFKEAVYPEEALKQNIQADVTLEIDIDDTGAVEGVTVAIPADPPGMGFDEAATEAALQFVFEPAKEGDLPVPVRITYKYRFVPKVEEAPVQPLQNPLPGEVAQAETKILSSPAPELPPPSAADFKGVLLERGTRLPLVGVTVIVFRKIGDKAEGFEAVTDDEGQFSFTALTPGDWNVFAEPDGYYPLRTNEKLVARELLETKYFIEKGTYNPYDVLVEGERVKKEVNRTVISIEEAEKVPGTFGDVLNVVKNLPGVARTGPLGGNLVIRGSSPEDSSVFVDGAEVPILYHFVGLKSVVPSDMLESIEFYPGNFPVDYGRATGGIVDVKLKDLRPEKVGGSLDVNLLDAGLYLEAPVGKKFALAAGFRRSYFDGIIKQASSAGAPVTLESAPRYYDWQLLARFTPNEKHDLKLFIFGSDDRLVAVVENPADLSPELRATNAETSTTFYRSIIEYKAAPSDKIQNELKIAQGRNWLYVGLGDQLYLDLEFYTAQIRDALTLKASETIKLRLGLDYVFNKTDMAIKFPGLSKEGEAPGAPDLNTILLSKGQGMIDNSIAGFLELETRLFDRITFVPAIRYDYFSRTDASALSPRMTLRADIAEKWVVKGGVGLFYQEPSFDETDEVFGNPNLKLESAVHYSVGAEFKPLSHLTFDLTLFYKDMNNLVSRTNETVQRDGMTVPLRFNNGGEGRAYGAEFLIRHEFANNFSGWIAYTLSRAERKDYGSSEYRPFDFDQTHILTLLGEYQLPKNWSVSARFRFVTGKLYTPREGAVFNADSATYEPILGETNSKRNPPFYQLDLRVDKKWIFENWIFTAYLDVQNATNRQNPEGYRYNYDSTEKQVRAGLPIIPVLGIKGEF
jgi:TonB family protein